MKEKILAREKECFEFLKAIPRKRKFVLIGAYAVSGYGFPRLSVDLDIVIPENELDFFENLCKSQDFILTLEKSDFEHTYSGEYKRYIKKGDLPTSVDLMINSVRSRQTGYAYSFNYILKSSEIREIRGWHPDSKVQIRIADKEMLIAMKINSMRTADKRDIIMLCYDKPDVDKIIVHLKKCPKDIILKHLKELNDLFDPKHKDSMKGVFSISDDVLKIAIRNTKRPLEIITKELKS